MLQKSIRQDPHCSNAEAAKRVLSSGCSWEELVNYFCSCELTSYEQIFEGADAFGYSSRKDFSLGYPITWSPDLVPQAMRSREMRKAEAFLKVICQIDSVTDTCRALLPEGTPMEFQRIRELKVIMDFYLPFSIQLCFFLAQF